MDLNLITTLIIRLVVLLMGIIVMRYLIPWLDKKFQVDKNIDIEFWTNTFVLAADQTLGIHCGTNGEKYALVRDMLSKTFPELDSELKDALIEAAVKKIRSLEQKPKDVDS